MISKENLLAASNNFSFVSQAQCEQISCQRIRFTNFQSFTLEYANGRAERESYAFG